MNFCATVYCEDVGDDNDDDGGVGVLAVVAAAFVVDDDDDDDDDDWSIDSTALRFRKWSTVGKAEARVLCDGNSKGIARDKRMRFSAVEDRELKELVRLS